MLLIIHIETEGFIFCELHKEGNDNLLTITDGKFKIDLRLKNFTSELNCKLGTKVQILGEISKNEGIHT